MTYSMRTSRDRLTWAFADSSPVGCAPSSQVRALGLLGHENRLKPGENLLRAGLRAGAIAGLSQQNTVGRDSTAAPPCLGGLRD
jgi:hypothetical protein